MHFATFAETTPSLCLLCVMTRLVQYGLQSVISLDESSKENQDSIKSSTRNERRVCNSVDFWENVTLTSEMFRWATALESEARMIKEWERREISDVEM